LFQTIDPNVLLASITVIVATLLYSKSPN